MMHAVLYLYRRHQINSFFFSFPQIMAHQEVNIAEDERVPLVSPDQERCETKSRGILGLIFVAGSTLAMPTAAALAKISGGTFPSSEIVLVRGIIQAGLALMGCLWIGIHPLGKPGVRKWVVFRGIAGAFALVLYYFGILHLPLADVSVIINLHPMFAAVFASVFLKEPFGRFKRGCALLCLTGVVLVAKPSFLFDERQGGQEEGDSIRIIAIFATLMAAVLSAVAYVTVRKVGQQAHFLNHTLSFGALSAILSSLNFHDFQLPQEKYHL
ncbi:hypothetical protein BJV82DRAFT_598093 [Fennellomyces sp. T-0311]|nr:hypothetical protein BJV82DRAFT_598093 [Fennellomyces sp. T-0311]